MPRLFGTDGIRGVANVDLKPTTAYALGRATAHRLVGPRRRDRRRPGHAPLGRHVRGGDRRRRDEPRRRRPHRRASCRRRPSPSSPGAATFAAGIMVSASHNPADDNGLKVLDGARPEARRRRSRTSSSSSSGGPRSSAASATPRSGRMVDARELLDGYLRAPARASPRSIPAAGLRVVLDCAERLGLRRSGPRSSRRPGPTVEVIHAEPDGININVALRGDRPGRRWPRPSSRRGADVGFALDGDADRLIAVDAAGPRRRRRPGPRHPRARSPRPRRAAGRRPRRVGPVERRAPGAPSRRPAARSSGRRSATSTSSRGCRSPGPASAARRAAT